MRFFIVIIPLLAASSCYDLRPTAAEDLPRVDAGPHHYCGDGILKDGEECDDGNLIDRDGCTRDCQPARCGDGIVRIDVAPDDPNFEACDDGNEEDRDACTGCAIARCGDGVVRQGLEDCDDGNTVNTDQCSNACEPARCGDGILRLDRSLGDADMEQCDDGNGVDTDSCTSSCRHAQCGDGILRLDLEMGAPGAEDCDDGNEIDDDGCQSDCTLPFCGDGRIQAGEGCDDGNGDGADGCTNRCQPARCGDGIQRRDLEEGEAGFEACDDGNPASNDGCLANCQLTYCGDGRLREDLQPGQEGYEACDDGNNNDQDACTNACTVAVCGDGIQRTDLPVDHENYESCDDQNNNPFDTCFQCENTCSIHGECPGDTGFCRVPPGWPRGWCMDTQRLSCTSNSDCNVRDRAGNESQLICDNNRCRRGEFQTCSADLACADGLDCALYNGDPICIRFCTEQTDCLNRRTFCVNGQYCWNRYCGAADELPGAFANLANGELGGACENLPGSGPNGYCHEIPVGNDLWVGVCFEGGDLPEGAACDRAASRDEDGSQCAGGLVCAGSDASGTPHCRRGCTPEFVRGTRDCPAGSSCLYTYIDSENYGYACIPEEEHCDTVALDSCGADKRCFFGSFRFRDSYCEAQAPQGDRVEPWEECSHSRQCPDGYFCAGNNQCSRACAEDSDCPDQLVCPVDEGDQVTACQESP